MKGSQANVSMNEECGVNVSLQQGDQNPTALVARRGKRPLSAQQLVERDFPSDSRDRSKVCSKVTLFFKAFRVSFEF